MLFKVNLIAQLVAKRSSNLNMRVQIQLWSAFLVDLSSVGKFMKYSIGELTPN